MALAKVRALHPDIFSDEDVCEVSIPARWLFAGLWCYACDNGHLADKPKQIKRWIYATDNENVAELLRELEAADGDLIVRADGWITIPGLPKRQRVDRRWFKTCEREGCVAPEKPEKADSQRETRRGHDEARGGHDVATRGHAADVDGDVVRDGDGDGEESGLAPAAPTRLDVQRLCLRLADRIAANGSKRPSITKRWLDAARLMLDTDGRSEAEIAGAIDWCQADEFWRSNILSMPKLREKYDTLRLQAQRKTGQQSRNDIDWDLAMERARSMGGGQ
ncbi:hypothetical protein [Nocardioides sp. SR21]|uniref:hypothetical protein n=1 Tax=Nocardioides sp. SR21 TaxID=2919501 RepID=UPI001FAABEE4|nr:hypothetical protein [Nocardioides sp. SR21]